MSAERRPVRHPAIETAVFGSEAVLYDERAGMVHHLNSSACTIWLLLDGRSVTEVVEAVAETVGVAAADIKADVVGALDDLDAAGLLAY